MSTLRVVRFQLIEQECFAFRSREAPLAAQRLGAIRWMAAMGLQRNGFDSCLTLDYLIAKEP